MKRLTILCAGLLVLLAVFIFFSLAGLLPMASARTVVFLNDQCPAVQSPDHAKQDGIAAEYHFNKNVMHLIDDASPMYRGGRRIVPRLEPDCRPFFPALHVDARF
jgi:hypothetical protein